jgi:hypothetical protein
MKKIIILTSLTLIHAIISFGLFLKVFSAGMSRFETGELPSLGEKILGIFSTILFWPIVYPLSIWGGKTFLNIFFHGILGYIPLLLNSFIWALAIYWIIKKVKINRKKYNTDFFVIHDFNSK